MEITGKLIQKLPVQSGVSSTGNNWSKAEFVIETIEQYPKKVCANLWGERAKALDQFQLGSLITVSFDLESREYNGRWYTDVKAWKVEAATPAAAARLLQLLYRLRGLTPRKDMSSPSSRLILRKGTSSRNRVMGNRNRAMVSRNPRATRSLSSLPISLRTR